MRFLLREAKKVDGLFLFWPGGPTPICVVANPAAAKAVLADHRRYPKGDDYRDKFGAVFGDGLVTSNGPAHARARRVLGRYFTRAALEAKEAAIAAAFDATAAEIFADVGSSYVDVDVQEFFHLATLRAFCAAMLSEDIYAWRLPGMDAPGAVARHVAREVSFGSNVVGEHMLYNIPMSPLLPRVRRLARSAATVRREVFAPLLARRRAAVAAGTAPDDCLTALVVASDADDGGAGGGDAAVMDQLVTLIGAGHDTSAYFCCYASLSLARCQRDARAESHHWFWGTPRTHRNSRSAVKSNSYPAVSRDRSV